MSALSAATTKTVKLRKARKQATKKEYEGYQQAEGRLDYNIWHHRHVGERFEKKQRKRAQHRCNIARDAGWSKGCKSPDSYFCLYFARGCCALGPDCPFLHRLPTNTDEKRIQITKDAFGRPKYATDRPDMGGFGCFKRECKLLYVSGLKNVPQLEQQLILNFKEWGRLEYVRVYPEKCYAFIKYQLRLCAEFAKEAMEGQDLPLGAGSALDIRWGVDDSDQLTTKALLHSRQKEIIDKLDENQVETKFLSFEYPEHFKPQQLSLPSHLESSTSDQTLTTNAQSKEDKAYLDIYQDYYRQMMPQVYQQLKSSTEHVSQPQPSTTQDLPQHDTKTTTNEPDSQNPLSYENYLHRQLRDAAEHEKRKREEAKQQHRVDSSVADLYPENDDQFEEPPKKRMKHEESE